MIVPRALLWVLLSSACTSFGGFTHDEPSSNLISLVRSVVDTNNRPRLFIVIVVTLGIVVVNAVAILRSQKNKRLKTRIRDMELEIFDLQVQTRQLEVECQQEEIRELERLLDEENLILNFLEARQRLSNYTTAIITQQVISAAEQEAYVPLAAPAA